MLEGAYAWVRVQHLAEHPDRNRETLSALGGAVSYMCSCLLDKAVLPLRRFSALPACSLALGPAGAALQPEAVRRGPLSTLRCTPRVCDGGGKR